MISFSALKPSNSAIIKIFSLFIFVLSGCAGVLYADDNGKAQTSASYLWIAPTARAAAMGNSFVALADDAGAVYYNPAGIAQLHHYEGVLSSSLMGVDRSYNYLGFVYSFEKGKKEEDEETGWYFGNEGNGSSGEDEGETEKKLFRTPKTRYINFGIALVNFGVGGIESRDIYGTQQGSFSDSENTLILSCGSNIFENLFWGVSVKGHKQDLYSDSASGYGIDTGFLLRNPKDNFSFGLCVQNISDKMKWNVYNDISRENDQYSEPVAMDIKLGSAYTPLSKKMTLLLDIDYISHQNIGWHIGSEFQALKAGVVRVGFDNLNPTFGFGLNIIKSSFNMVLDYSFLLDTQNLSHQHRVAFTLR